MRGGKAAEWNGRGRGTVMDGLDSDEKQHLIGFPIAQGPMTIALTSQRNDLQTWLIK